MRCLKKVGINQYLQFVNVVFNNTGDLFLYNKLIVYSVYLSVYFSFISINKQI